LGPAGALVNINSKLVAENGVEIIPYVAMLTGVFTIICWFLKLE
jgi:MFS superfamily sulfate permease-like transporter